MLNPIDFSLCDVAITAAQPSVAYSPIIDLYGMQAATITARFAYGTGGTSAKAYVQTSLDAGITWIDIACFAFTTASGIRVINLSGLTPVTTAYAPTDGAMADDTVKDGILGSSMRVKLLTTGTYANTVMSVKASAR